MMIGAAFLSPLSVRAGMESALDGMFVSVTKPSAYQSQKRMGMVGGDLSIRIPNQAVNITTLDLPRLDMGCGSIDMHGGSFSFINTNQLIGVLRNIGQIATVALFQLAIGAISEQLKGVLSEFSDKLLKLNTMKMNSCRVGEKLALEIWDAASSSLGAAADQSNKVLDNMRGRSSNWPTFLGTLFDPPKAKPGPDWDEGNPNVANLTWRALFKSQAHVELFPGIPDETVALLIINIVGTRIVKTSGDSDEASCRTIGFTSEASGNGNFVCENKGQRVPGTLRPEMLFEAKSNDKIYGFSDMSSSENGWQNGTGPNVSVTGDLRQSGIFPGGTKALAYRVLFGRDGAAQKLLNDGSSVEATGGIVYFIGQGSWGDFDATKYLGSMTIPILRHLVTVQREEGASGKVANEFAPLLAEEMGVHVAKRLADAAGKAFGGTVGAEVSKPKDYDDNLHAFRIGIQKYESNAEDRLNKEYLMAQMVALMSKSFGSGAMKPSGAAGRG